MTDFCYISIYSLGRNRGIVFIYFGFWPGKNVVFYSICLVSYCFAQLLLC